MATYRIHERKMQQSYLCSLRNHLHNCWKDKIPDIEVLIKEGQTPLIAASAPCTQIIQILIGNAISIASKTLTSSNTQLIMKNSKSTWQRKARDVKGLIYQPKCHSSYLHVPSLWERFLDLD